MDVGFRYWCKTPARSGNITTAWKDMALTVVEGEHASSYN